MPVQEIRVFALNASTYTPIVTPIDCNFYNIMGTSDGTAMRRSSDGTDENSHIIPASDWYSFEAPVNIVVQNPVPTKAKDVVGQIRWMAGYTVTYLKAISGTPDVSVEFSI